VSWNNKEEILISHNVNVQIDTVPTIMSTCSTLPSQANQNSHVGHKHTVHVSFRLHTNASRAGHTVSVSWNQSLHSKFPACHQFSCCHSVQKL